MFFLGGGWGSEFDGYKGAQNDYIHTFFRQVMSTPDPDTFEKYSDAPPISIAIRLQKHALFLAESSTIGDKIITCRFFILGKYVR